MPFMLTEDLFKPKAQIVLDLFLRQNIAFSTFDICEGLFLLLAF